MEEEAKRLAREQEELKEERELRQSILNFVYGLDLLNLRDMAKCLEDYGYNIHGKPY